MGLNNPGMRQGDGDPSSSTLQFATKGNAFCSSELNASIEPASGLISSVNHRVAVSETGAVMLCLGGESNGVGVKEVEIYCPNHQHQ